MTDQVAPWEDGRREPTGPGHLEWWYFDAQFADGGAVAVTAATKPPGGDTSPPLRPTVRTQYVAPDGASIEVQPVFPTDAFTAGTDRCDVRIGPNHIVGDLHAYHIVTDDPQLSLDLTFTATVPAARIGTGGNCSARPGSTPAGSCRSRAPTSPAPSPRCRRGSTAYRSSTPTG